MNHEFVVCDTQISTIIEKNPNTIVLLNKVDRIAFAAPEQITIEPLGRKVNVDCVSLTSQPRDQILDVIEKRLKSVE